MHSISSIRHPPRYVLISMLASFGGFLFGMDTGIIGPVTVMSDYVSLFGAQSAIVHGAIVSSILIPAALSSLIAGHVADLLGRPKGIGIGALVFGLGAALQAGAVDLAMFVVGRGVEGFGEGLYLSTLVVYICEITPPSRRGPLTTGPQLLLTFGLLTGYFTCYGTANMSSSLSWRITFIILASLSILFSIASFLYLEPSPRWLSLRGRKSEAAIVWDKLQVEQIDRETGLDDSSNGPSQEIATHSIDEKTEESKTRPRAFEIFSASVRARTFLGVFVMSMQQLSGIDGVLYYAPLIFQQAGIDTAEASFLASGVSAIVILVATIPATIFADKWGRRSSVITGGLGMGSIMLVIGVLYAAKEVSAGSPARWVVIVAVYVYVVLYCGTWSVSCKVYAAEVQPQRTRASATNLSHGGNWVTNFVVALTTPVLLSRSDFAAYFLWAGCLLFTAVVCIIFMPETKGRPLDEIEAAFHAETTWSQGRRKIQRIFKDDH